MMESVRLHRLTTRVWLHKCALVFLSLVFLTLIFKALKSSKRTVSQSISEEHLDHHHIKDDDPHAEEMSSENYGVCQQPQDVGNLFQLWSKANQTPLIIITPTYERSEQIAELTRLSQTLQLLAIWAQMPLIWIIAHDSRVCHEHVKALIDRKTWISSLREQAGASKPRKKKTQRNGTGEWELDLKNLLETFSSSLDFTLITILLPYREGHKKYTFKKTLLS